MARDKCREYEQEQRTQETYKELCRCDLLPEKEQIMKYKGISIHKNKKCETWYTRFRRNGRVYYVCARTQKECYNKLKIALREAEKGIEQLEEERNKQITLIEWYHKWLELYKIGKVKDQTLRDYRSLLSHIPEEIQQAKLKDIGVEDIVITLNNCKAERQRQKLHELLKALFEKAKNTDIITRNVVMQVEKPKHDKDHGIALTNQQQHELIRICQGIQNSDVILVALYQGLRRGEVLGLTVDNIDFENNTLTINKAWSEYNKYETTKNKQSMRTIPLFNEAKQILLKYKDNKERVFDITNQACTKMLIQVRKAMNMPKLHMKDMRSTFITRCKELQIPKHVIQSWVGHVIGSAVTDIVYTKHNKEIDYNYINIINNTNFKS